MLKTIVFKNPKHINHRTMVAVNAMLNFARRKNHCRYTKWGYESLTAEEEDNIRCNVENAEELYGVTDTFTFVWHIAFSYGYKDDMNINDELIQIMPGTFEGPFKLFYFSSGKTRNYDDDSRRSMLTQTLEKYTTLMYRSEDEEDNYRHNLTKKKIAVFDIIEDNHYSTVIVVNFDSLCEI